MMYLGCDPGAKGALVLLDESGGLVRVIDMPVVEMKVGSSLKRRVSPELLAAELRGIECRAVVEQVSSMPGQGVSSSFSFGESFGLVKGVFAGLHIPFTTVTPSKWKREMGVNASKDGSRAMAISIWVQHAELFKRVKDADRAEAALLALWLFRHGEK
jgi:crossover junction endodeoxyribonuclease RuvC